MQKRLKIIISFSIAFITTIIIIMKMIYQVNHLKHEDYNVECPGTNTTQNSAAWFGLKKAAENGGLIVLLRYYIIYMIVTTIYAVIRLRQSQLREKYASSVDFNDKVMFPEIVRADAEKNIKGLLKYLCNYGYYKFGMEICLIWLVSTITYRQDIMAAFYAIWLIVFISLSRAQSERLWNFFQLFIAVAILVQYIVLLNLPPTFCIVYPWQDSMFSASFEGWALLPGNLHYDHSKKLMFDFILLMCVNRQRKVFNLEKGIPLDSSFAGGSNKSVVEDIKNLGQEPFENPTRDFLSSVRNYLDILKNIVMCGLFWVTLCVIFLAGTNIGDLLGLGYLIAAMMFLWSGSDFYLKPINVILRYWKLLIFYNVANIIFKTFMQLAGCIFMKILAEKCCWFVHLLSISCASSMEPIAIPIESDANIDTCPPIDTHVVLVWDAICFALLICQLRIFKSHYFCHIILDARANSLLASRGAVLIEELRQKQIIYRQEHESEVLVKIKRKMEKIRATQQKMLRPLDKPTHFDVNKRGSSFISYASSEDLTKYVEQSDYSSLIGINSMDEQENCAPTINISKRYSESDVESLEQNLDNDKICATLKPETERRKSSTGNVVSWKEEVKVKNTELPVTLRQKSLNRRHLSMGNASHLLEAQRKRLEDNRRFSNISTCNIRPYSWGPIVSAFYWQTLRRDSTESRCHGQCTIELNKFFFFFFF